MTERLLTTRDGHRAAQSIGARAARQREEAQRRLAKLERSEPQ